MPNSEGIDIYGTAAVSNPRSAYDKIKKVMQEIKRYGFSRSRPFSVGAVEKRMKDYAKEKNITIASGNLYLSAQSIAHARREGKVSARIAVSEKSLMEFPRKRSHMRLFYDKEKKTFVYVDGRNKFVIHPDYNLKFGKERKDRVVFVTDSKLSSMDEFNMKKYDEIKRR